jgi:mono/diheme cytochrome c family protein
MSEFLTKLLSTVPWPFPVRPSFENLADPQARHLLAVALSLLGLAALVVTISIVARRGRVVAVLVALTVLFLRGPSLSLLFVSATPASYRSSPTGFTVATIASGRQVFASSCTPCHGNTGDGVGGLGSIADLRRPHIWSHPTGDLFWFVSHGIKAADGPPLMPAFESALSERARWSVIDYVHALNAGSVSRGLDGWPHSVSAPSLSLSCRSIAARGTAELSGKVIRIILGEVPTPLSAVPPVNGIDVVTVWIPGGEAEAALVPGVDCVAQEGAEVYSILAGSADGRVIPARFLIGPDGVLRSVWRKEDGDAWADPVRLLEEVRAICSHPLTIDSGEEHDHHHH